MKETRSIEQLWKAVYITGIGDTLRGLNLLSYLFILKYLEERSIQLGPQDTTFSSIDAEECYWSMIRGMARTDADACCQHLRNNVGTWLASLDPESCLNDAAPVFAQLLPSAVYKLIDGIDTLCEESLSSLDAFEAILTWAEKEGAFQPRAGQIMTPPHIAYLMADLLRPQIYERMMDASCGTGNLLVAALQQMRQDLVGSAWSLANGRMLLNPETFQSIAPMLFGYDADMQMCPAAYAHLLLSGIDCPQVRCSDALGSVFNQRLSNHVWGTIDKIILNPPFNGFLDLPDLGETLKEIDTHNTELLFVELTLQLLRTGGQAALLIPDGVVRNSLQAAVELRKKLVQNHRLQAVISLPAGVFLPLTGVKSTILLFQKDEPTGDPVLFYRVREDGFAFDARRQERPERNDLWDLRLQVAAALDQMPPLPVQEFLGIDWWDQYKSDPSSVYVTPKTATRTIDPLSGKNVPAFQQITGFDTADSPEEERSWFVSLEEIEASGNYSLCADTYREPSLAQAGQRRGGRKNR